MDELRTIEDINNAYHNLTMSIIRLACKDYMKSIRSMKKSLDLIEQGKTKDIPTTTYVRELIFFYSDWFSILSSGQINPDALVEGMNKKINKVWLSEYKKEVKQAEMEGRDTAKIVLYTVDEVLDKIDSMRKDND